MSHSTRRLPGGDWRRDGDQLAVFERRTDLLLRCCELDLRLAASHELVPDGELEQLLSLHFRARGFGLQDEVMSTVLKCLDRNGRATEAQWLLLEYLREFRRDGFAVPSWLRAGQPISLERPSPTHENGLPVSAGHSIALIRCV